MRLQEEVFGALAFVYTGSQAPPDVFIPMIVNDDLILAGSALEELPLNLRVGGKLDITGTDHKLRDDIEVDRIIRMKVNFWGDIPDKFRSGRKIFQS